MISSPAATVAANLIINEVEPRLRRLGLEASPISGKEIAILAACKVCGVLTTRDIRRLLDELLRPRFLEGTRPGKAEHTQ